MAFHVGDQKEVGVLLTFLECKVFITEGRTEYQFVGDQILPARSALELVRADLGADLGARLDDFDAFVRANAEAFNSFFAYEHALVVRETALEDWVWGDDGKTPAIPADHWWWAPISAEAAS